MTWFVFFLPALAGAICPLIYSGYRRMLKYKRDEIISLMSKGEAFKQYLEAFRTGGTQIPTTDEEERTQLVQTVDELFNAYYDWRTYLIPIGICSVSTFMVCTVALIKAGVNISWLPSELTSLAGTLPAVALAAIAGAYIWGLYDMVQNFINLNLTPTRIHFVWLRLLIAPIVGYLVATPLNDAGKLIAGFAVGIFPLQQILDFMAARGAKMLNFESASVAAEGPTLHNLQGLSKEMLDILNDECIHSTQHLAQADPIKLLLRTRLEWKIILDLIDQAYLFNYLGEKMIPLRAIGIRGAIELAAVSHDLKNEDVSIRTTAEQLLGIIASMLGQGAVETRNLIFALEEDIQVQFIWNLWGEAGLG